MAEQRRKFTRQNSIF